MLMHGAIIPNPAVADTPGFGFLWLVFASVLPQIFQMCENVVI